MSFKCNQCNRTWPDKKNKMDDPNKYSKEGICPECYEGDDDEDEDSRNPFGNISAKKADDDDDDDDHPWQGHGRHGLVWLSPPK